MYGGCIACSELVGWTRGLRTHDKVLIHFQLGRKALRSGMRVCYAMLEYVTTWVIGWWVGRREAGNVGALRWMAPGKATAGIGRVRLLLIALIDDGPLAGRREPCLNDLYRRSLPIDALSIGIGTVYRRIDARRLLHVGTERLIGVPDSMKKI